MAKTKKEKRAKPRSAQGRLVPKDKRAAMQRGERLMRGAHIATNIRARLAPPTLPPSDESDES